MSDETEMNNIRAVGLQWQSEMVTAFAAADTSSPPVLEERWISLKAYISYYLQRGWRFS